MLKRAVVSVTLGAEEIRRAHLALIRAKCAKTQQIWSNPKVQTLYHQRERWRGSYTISLTEDAKKTTLFLLCWESLGIN